MLISRLRFFWLTSALILGCLLQGNAQDILVIGDSLQKYDLQTYLEFLPDQNNDITIVDATSVGFSNKFSSFSSEAMAINEDVLTHWFRFKMRNPKGEKTNYLLRVDDIDYATLYDRQPSGEYVTRKSGTLYGLHERDIFLGRVPHISFSLGPHEEKTFYLHLELQTPFNIQNRDFLGTYENLQVQELEPAVAEYHSSRYFQGFYFGAVVIIALYNLFLFLFVRDRNYLFFVFFTLSAGISHMILEGYALEFLWSDLPTVDLVAAYNLLALSWCFFLFFTSYFLDLKKAAPVWHKMIRVSAYSHLFFIGLTLVGVWKIQILVVLIFITIALIIGLNVWFTIKGYRPAKYFLYANFFFLAGNIVLYLALFDIIPQNSFTWHGEEIGEMLQALLFSIALADRINLMQEEINQRTIEEAQLREKQETERKRIIEEQKVELEATVQRRTAEISSINAELEEQKEEILQQRDYIEQKNEELERNAQELQKSRDVIDKAYKDIMILSDIGREITATLDSQRIMMTVYSHIHEMMPVYVFGVGLYEDENDLIRFEDFIVGGIMQGEITVGMKESDRLSTWCLKKRRPIFIGDFDEEYRRYVSVKQQGMIVAERKSIIYLPLETEHRVIGVMTVQSLEKNAYKESDLKILETLASYIAIALDNSDAYDEIAKQHKEIDHKNQLITASLRYAQDIQEVILPEPEKMFAMFGDHFVMYRPKDYVSGDFYWVREHKGKRYIAVADCTGHGVPGAFMSMIGTTLLNQLVAEIGFSNDLGKLLELLHEGVQKVLKQEEESNNNDGMDVCLCLIEDAPDRPTKGKLTFAGAKRPIYYYSQQKLHEIKGTRRSIGGRPKRKKVYRPFERHELYLNQGDVLYLTTDGYVDQSAPDRKKFGSIRLLKLFEQIASLPMREQGRILNKQFFEHKGHEEQRDDVTILGINFD